MGVLYLCLVIIIGIISAMIFPDKQVEMKWFYIFSLAVMAGLTYNVYDYDVYESQYYASRFFEWDYSFYDSILYGYSRDVAYLVINKISYIANLDYVEFRFIISCIFIYLFYKGIFNFTSEISVVFVLYIMHPFYQDVMQVRNFIIEVLFLWCVSIYTSKKRYYRIKTMLLLIVSTMFHSMSILFFPLLLIDKVEKNQYLIRIVKIFAIIGICMPLYLGVVQNNLSILGDYMLLVTEDSALSHYHGYLGAKINYGPYLVWGYTLFSLYLSYKLLQLIKKKYSYSEVKIRFSKITYYFMVYATLLLPLSCLNPNIIRFVRNLNILLYIVIAMYLTTVSSRQRIVIFMACILAFFAIGFAEGYYNIGLYVLDTFNMNYVFELLE